MKIAIDGPAGSGKSSVAKIISNKLNILFIDTGAMYRSVTYNCIKNNIDLNNTDEIINISNNSDIKLVQENNKLIVYLNEEDVSEKIRTLEVTNNVHKIAAIGEVRSRLVDLQRRYGEHDTVIMDGRDIGTVVFPDAEVKIYLDASVEERTNRRLKELKEKNVDITFEQLKKEVEDRDASDRNRKIGPLKIAEDAIVLDTTGLSINQVVDKIIEIIKKNENSRIPANN